MMKPSLLRWASAAWAGVWMAASSAALSAPAAPSLLPLTRVQVRLPSGPPHSAAVADLSCPSVATPSAVASRAARPAAPPASDPLDIPDADSVAASLRDLARDAANGNPLAFAPAQDRLDDVLRGLTAGRHTPLRVAIWGDSHLAAGFFTDTLVRQTGLPPERVQASFLPGSINRPGIRLPLRRSCLSAGWRHEPGYLSGNGTAPGPGLVNLSTSEAGAWLALDLRNTAGQPERRPLRLLYQQTPTPIQLAISLDGGQEYMIELPGGPAGPAALDLLRDTPVTQLRLRLLQGALRWHGLAFGATPAGASPALILDVFGYPGATANAWRQADLAYLGNWFQDTRYDVVMLEYGTNEGNVRSLDGPTYQQNLRQAVSKLRTLFPQAACVLIAPGDRGTLVRRGSAGSEDLLRFSRIHADIGRLQHQVAQDFGCKVWSMQTAMGGLGSAYQWVRQSPALMARDLIHFSVPGYQQLARQFFSELGWDRVDWARVGIAAPALAEVEATDAVALGASQAASGLTPEGTSASQVQ